MQSLSDRTLTIAPLSTPNTISLSAIEACAQAKRLYVQTAQTPCVKPLTERNIRFESMDDLYASAEDFEALNDSIAQRLIQALEHGDVVYAVPGSGMGDGINYILQEAVSQGANAERLCGVSFAMAAAGAAGAAFDTATVAMANALPNELDTSHTLLIEEIDTPMRAGEVKLKLMEYYPDDYTVKLCHMSRDGAYKAEDMPLYDLDRQKSFHATSVLIVPAADERHLTRYGFNGLTAIMRELREKCPWDRKQTHESLKKNLIEECYEVLYAIDAQDDASIAEELGDVLLQCVFHAQIACEQGRFDIRDVTTGIVQKLVYRHPHIFSDVKADTSEQVLKNWEELKKKEKRFESQSEALCAVPKNLPALMRACKVQKKAADVGFDWDSPEDAFVKLREEADELEAAMRGEGIVSEEMGDMLFACVNVSRLLGLDPEETLTKSTEKFISRFARMEAIANKSGNSLNDLSFIEQDELWRIVKSDEISEEIRYK